MNRTILSLLIGYSLLASSPATGVAASWDGAKVVPKSHHLSLAAAPGEGSRGGAYQVEWPATVKKTDGQWLQISDAGGYSIGASEGWVRKDDIVRLDEAQFYATKKIQECDARNAAPRDAAEFYWLRGVYWEYTGETDSAIDDYTSATVGHESLTGDVYLGLGRALARRANHLALRADERASSFDKADESFANAEAAFKRSLGGRCPPQLYATWGNVLHDRYRASGKAQDAEAALEKYKVAQRLRPTWFVPLHGQGRVLVALTGAQNPDPKILLDAIQCFSQSIRANPNCAEAYRERADALVLLAATSGPYTADQQRAPLMQSAAFTTTTTSDSSTASRVQRMAILNQALDSAERAYLLGNNREPGSLETKARVEAAIASVVYADDPPLLGKPVPAQLKGPIDQARSLYRRASDHASTAANYSQTLDEVDRRLAFAVDCHSRARQYAGYLASNAPAATGNIRAASAKLAAAVDQAGQIENKLALEAADLHAAPLAAAIAQQSASMAKVKKEANEVQNRLNEAVARSPAERRQDLEVLRSKVSDTSEAIKREHASLAEKLAAEPDPQKRKGLEETLEKNQQLSQTLQQAADELSPVASEPVQTAPVDDTGPVYIPLFLNR